jgi:Major Facilitator Superfamily/Domain of unknown function (DUF1772)
LLLDAPLNVGDGRGRGLHQLLGLADVQRRPDAALFLDPRQPQRFLAGRQSASGDLELEGPARAAESSAGDRADHADLHGAPGPLGGKEVRAGRFRSLPIPAPEVQFPREQPVDLEDIVAAAMVITCVGFGAMFSLGVFLEPMSAAESWSRTGISTAALLDFLCMGLGSFLWGWLSDRFGTRAVVLTGGVLLGLGTVLASHAPTLTSFQIYFGVMVGFASGSLFTPLTATTTRWLWLMGAGAGWLVAALLIGAVVPFTLVVIMPTNHELLAPGRDPAAAGTRTLLERWGRLHAVRSVLGLLATGLYLWLLRAAP